MATDNFEYSDQPVNDPVPQPKPGFGFWSTTGFGMLIMVAYLVVTVCVMIAYLAIKTFDNTGIDLELFIANIVADGFFLSLVTIITAITSSVLIFVVVMVKMKGVSVMQYLGFRKVSRKVIILSIVVMIGYILIADLVSWLLGGNVTTEWMDAVYSSSVVTPLLWVALIIFAPAWEELFFRGFLFAGFKNSRLGVIGATILTSLIWTGLHTQYNIYGITSIFITGILFGIIRHKSGSIWTTLLLHALMNLVATTQIAVDLNGMI